jgi:uncharacterized membrane protein HdeD (DUF308 family)
MMAKARWQLPLIFGAFTLLFGLLALFWPGQTLVTIALFFGLQLILLGIARLFDVVTEHEAFSGGERVLSALVGLLAIIAGLYAVRHLLLTLMALVLVLGIFWIIHGVAMLMGAFPHDNPHRLLAALTGGLSIIAGLIVTFAPVASMLALALVLGVWLVILGVLEIIRAIQLRQHLSGWGSTRAAGWRRRPRGRTRAA